MVYCKNCGKENKKGKFCKFCGVILVKPKLFTLKNVLIISVVILFILAIIELIALSTPVEKDNLFGNVQKINYLLAGKKFCGDHNCNENELYFCKKDCVWCGDGTCQTDEIGSCYEDCEWCGDGYCEQNENCNICSKDCGSCQAKAYCGDGICNPDECKIGCNKDCPISQCENGVCEPQKEENCVIAPNDCRCKLNERCNRETKICETITCGNNICDLNENSLICPNDCKEEYKELLLDPNKDLPIIFVHGHTVGEDELQFGPRGWYNFQKKLENEGYEAINVVLLPSDYPPKSNRGVWNDKKLSVTMTYYFNRYNQLGDVVVTADNQPIDVYAQRLKDIVEVVKHNTGKNRVIIVAHSMGGLVSRTYIKYYSGNKNVDKLITIGTPNHGIYGYVASLCQIGRGLINTAPECDEMQYDSSFINNLNSPSEVYSNIKYLAIIGINTTSTSCPNNEKWDGVICSSSAKLNGAENFIFSPITQYSGRLHRAMINPDETSEVYNKIVEFLRK